VSIVPISVPTVVEIPLADEFIERFDFAVLNKTTNSFEPYFFKQETLMNETPLSVSTSPANTSAGGMNDNNIKTYADFPLPDTAQGRVDITLSGANPIISSSITALLDDNVALPNSIEIRALVGGQNRIVVARRIMSEQTVRFPQTISGTWTITFTFGQPLRIKELRLNQDNATKISNRAIRFLAQPNQSYRIYFDPDRTATAPVGEAGNLVSAEGVFFLSSLPSLNNPNYIIADTDKDGIPDTQDNCTSLANPDQKDINGNGRGDVCDDFDRDGIINATDNCPDNPNMDQKDADGDTIGDICDKEESRITERHNWIPWAGIGFAALVIVTLLAVTARSTRITDQNKTI
jgi:hypothetical protein